MPTKGKDETVKKSAQADITSDLPVETTNRDVVNTDRTHLFFSPLYPCFSSYCERVKSFDSWSIFHCQHPSQLARAGFFYDGINDETTCFHCGVCIRDWERNDNAWIEHSRWSPFCHFLLMETSSEFVRDCLKNKPPIYNYAVRKL